MSYPLKTICVVLLAIIPILSYWKRKLSTKSKKAAELYYQADNYWVRGQFLMAFELLQKAIDKDEDFYEAYFRL
ncbi:MAG: hypothetical protein R3345_15045, partial [Fulvivirga sp.]|nr:hypothetical protein [Fulvivirga sp.]